MPKEVGTSTEYDQLTQSGKVVVDFYAVWCGPCVAIAPYYVELSSKYPGVTFLKVNVDSPGIKGAMALAKVRCMPTFVFYNNGAIVDRLEGANQGALAQKIASLSSK